MPKPNPNPPWRLGTKPALLWTALWLLLALLLCADVHYHGQFIQHDEPIAHWIHDHATPQAAELCSYLTHLGSPTASLTIGTLVALWLATKKRWGQLIWWILALSGAALLTNVLKPLFARPRPVMHTFFPPAPGFSFPSGHTMGSTILIGMLAYLLMRQTPRPRDRRTIAAFALLLTLAVPASLLYIGVHFLTDLLAALALAWAWLGFCILALEREGD